MAKKQGISEAVIKRLPRYYRYVKQLEHDGVKRVSSSELAKNLCVTASQVRQDFQISANSVSRATGTAWGNFAVKSRRFSGSISSTTLLLSVAATSESACEIRRVFRRRFLRPCNVRRRSDGHSESSRRRRSPERQ